MIRPMSIKLDPVTLEVIRNALPAMNAWLRWHLNGETNRKAEFSPGGKYFSGIWSSQVKNWN